MGVSYRRAVVATTPPIPQVRPPGQFCLFQRAQPPSHPLTNEQVFVVDLAFDTFLGVASLSGGTSGTTHKDLADWLLIMQNAVRQNTTIRMTAARSYEKGSVMTFDTYGPLLLSTSSSGRTRLPRPLPRQRARGTAIEVR